MFLSRALSSHLHKHDQKLLAAPPCRVVGRGVPKHAILYPPPSNRGGERELVCEGAPPVRELERAKLACVVILERTELPLIRYERVGERRGGGGGGGDGAFFLFQVATRSAAAVAVVRLVAAAAGTPDVHRHVEGRVAANAVARERPYL